MKSPYSNPGIYYNSWLFTKCSFHFFWQNPVLSLMMLINFLLTSIIILAVGFTFKIIITKFNSMTQFWAEYLLIFITLVFLITLFILVAITVTYFNSALIAITLKRLCQQEASFTDGFSQANKNIKSILKWALMGRALCLNLLLEDKPITLGKVFDFLISNLLSVPIYFVMPFIIYENTDPLSAIKRSIQVFGTNLLINLRVRSFLALIFFFGFLLLISLQNIMHASYFFILIIMWFIFSFILSTVLENISKCALYLYHAQNILPKDFDKSLLERVILPIRFW